MADDNAPIRHLRNFVVITFLILFVLAGCFYLTGTLVIITINGKWEIIKAYTGLPLEKQFLYILKTLLAYWKFYIDNSARLTIDSYNFFTLKLWITTLLPYSFLITFAWVFRAPLIDWRPFKKPESIHGDAKWAVMADIKKMGLRSKNGVLLGKYNKKFLVADGFQHILLFAPTGSGKGVGFVIPNLLFWRDSVIVHDIKLENYELSSGWRRTRTKNL
jgi:type IV secretion system protein VirD4